MEDMEDVKFVQEVWLPEGHPLWSSDAHQRMIEVVVKQETIDAEDNLRAETMDVGYGDMIRNEAAPATRFEVVPKKTVPKVIQHRRCTRIQRVNSVIVRRHLVQRAQPATDDRYVVHQPPPNTQFSDAQVTVGEEAAASANENIDGQQLARIVYHEINGNQMLDSTDSSNMYGMPCASPNEYQLEPMLNGGNAVESQVLDADIANMVSEYEIPMSALNFDAIDMAVAQYVQIEMEGCTGSILMNEQPAAEMVTQPIPSIPTQAAANRCDVCAQTFKTPKNLEKHLLSKKHVNKFTRMSKRNGVR